MDPRRSFYGVRKRMFSLGRTQLVFWLSCLHFGAPCIGLLRCVILGLEECPTLRSLSFYELRAGERLVCEKAVPRLRRRDRPISVSAAPVGLGIDIWKPCRVRDLPRGIHRFCLAVTKGSGHDLTSRPRGTSSRAMLDELLLSVWISVAFLGGFVWEASLLELLQASFRSQGAVLEAAFAWCLLVGLSASQELLQGLRLLALCLEEVEAVGWKELEVFHQVLHGVKTRPQCSR